MPVDVSHYLLEKVAQYNPQNASDNKEYYLNGSSIRLCVDSSSCAYYDTSIFNQYNKWGALSSVIEDLSVSGRLDEKTQAMPVAIRRPLGQNPLDAELMKDDPKGFRNFLKEYKEFTSEQIRQVEQNAHISDLLRTNGYSITSLFQIEQDKKQLPRPVTLLEECYALDTEIQQLEGIKQHYTHLKNFVLNDETRKSKAETDRLNKQRTQPFYRMKTFLNNTFSTAKPGYFVVNPRVSDAMKIAF